jgi:hypothetical protein
MSWPLLPGIRWPKVLAAPAGACRNPCHQQGLDEGDLNGRCVRVLLGKLITELPQGDGGNSSQGFKTRDFLLAQAGAGDRMELPFLSCLSAESTAATRLTQDHVVPVNQLRLVDVAQ